MIKNYKSIIPSLLLIVLSGFHITPGSHMEGIDADLETSTLEQYFFLRARLGQC